MMKTAPLRVIGDSKFRDGQVVIHPHAGAELNLWTTKHPVNVYFNCSLQEFTQNQGEGVQGELELKNECKIDTVEISHARWKAMGFPSHALLIRDNGRLLVYGRPQKAAARGA